MPLLSVRCTPLRRGRFARKDERVRAGLGVPAVAAMTGSGTAGPVSSGRSNAGHSSIPRAHDGGEWHAVPVPAVWQTVR